jgi:hypothetical protein
LGLDVNEIPHVDAENIHFDFEARGRGEFSFSGFRRRVLRSALGDREHRLSAELEVVQNPLMEGAKAGSSPGCMAVCFDLGGRLG